MRTSKRLLAIAGCLLLFLCCNGVLTYLLVPYQYARAKFHTLETQTFDTVILGSSHGFSAIDPAVLEAEGMGSCYNASMGGMFPRDNYYLLQDICRDHRMRNVILEYDPAYLVDEDRSFLTERYFVQSMRPSLVKLRYFLEAAWEEDLRVAFFPWFGYRTDFSAIGRNREIKNSVAYRACGVEPFATYGQQLCENGFMAIHEEVNDDAAPRRVPLTEEGIAGNLSDLERILRYCKEQGIALVVVRTPVPEETAREDPDYYETAHRIMEELTEAYAVPFLDYARSGDARIPYAREAFSDREGHMHEDAAGVFTEVLAEDLAQVLP